MMIHALWRVTYLSSSRFPADFDFFSLPFVKEQIFQHKFVCLGFVWKHQGPHKMTGYQ